MCLTVLDMCNALCHHPCMTPTRRLLEIDLGSLDSFVDTRRTNGDSWESIARDIYSTTNCAISGETLRRWYGGKP